MSNNSHFLTEAFDPTQVDPTQGSGGWPLGRHPVVATGVEVKATKDGNNGMASFTLEVIDGPEKGYKGFWNLNLYHESEKARNFARRDLSAMCHATQTFRLGAQGTDLSQLFNKPFVVDVGYQRGHNPATDGEEAKGYTEIKKLYDIHGNEPGKSGQGGGQAPQQNNQQTQNQGGNGGGWGNNNSNANQGQNNGGNSGGGWGNGQGQNNANSNDSNQGSQDNSQQGQGGGGWNSNGNNANNGGNNDQGNTGGNGGGNGGWQQGQGGNGGNGGPSWGQRN